MATTTTFSRTQIVLHWVIAALVIFQIVAHERIEDAWEARMDGTVANVPTPDPHVLIGILILALVLWRLVLRLTSGVPAPPEGEHPLLGLAGRVAHWLFYVLLIALPASGATAWFGGLQPPAAAHAVLQAVLVLLILLHVAAALAHHFVFRDDVLRRMLGMA